MHTFNASVVLLILKSFSEWLVEVIFKLISCLIMCSQHKTAGFLGGEELLVLQAVK